jgi:XTP/dITP diphosphohydrolase
MSNVAAEPVIITLASRNRGKQLELEYWLERHRLPFALAINPDAEDVPEVGENFLENALIKAQAVPPVSESGYVLAEDSGMIVDALDGQFGISPFPGLLSNRWLTPPLRDTLLGQSHPNRMPLDRVTETGVTNSDLCLGILALMEGKRNRAARYCCGMVLWHPERGVCAEAFETTELELIDGEPHGTNGFGYDPITRPVGDARTMAELDTGEKNRISHRGKAFEKILARLQAGGA